MAVYLINYSGSGPSGMAVAREFDRRMLTKMAFGNAAIGLLISDCYLALASLSLRLLYIPIYLLAHVSLIIHGGDVLIIVIWASRRWYAGRGGGLFRITYTPARREERAFSFSFFPFPVVFPRRFVFSFFFLSDASSWCIINWNFVVFFNRRLSCASWSSTATFYEGGSAVIYSCLRWFDSSALNNIVTSI